MTAPRADALTSEELRDVGVVSVFLYGEPAPERALAPTEGQADGRPMADETRADTCQWRYYDPPYLSDYETQCGQVFSFNDGGLEENYTRYCHWCGGRVIPPTPPLSDEEEADG